MRGSSLKSGEKVLVPQLKVATDFFSRFMGLMFRKNIGQEEGVFFPNCNSIHTCFMRFPIDIVFVSAEGEVTEIIPSLRPWRLLLPRKKVKHTIELASGRSAELKIEIGMKVSWA